MNRLKLLAAATLLMVPIACGDPIDPPPPTGSIDGLVSIEGQGIDGVSVTLSNGGSAITANGGMYRFDGVEAGAYTVTISNYPDDASFNQTSAAATISTDGETVTVNFPGTYIRTSSIMGTVTVENEGLNGITVKLSGVSDSETLTDGNGQYAFTGLRAGNYTIEISGFDDEDVAFGSTSSTATLSVGESKVVSFEGTYLRTSGIVGQVTADEEPQEGITVSLQGRGEDRSVTTNSSGQFAFEQLRRGDYSVVISGYNPDEMTFDVTSQSVTVAYGETANVPFAGILLRTAGIEGTVTVEGVGPIEATVTIQGEGESDSKTTDANGAYSFEGLPAGDYSVVITGFNDDLYGFFHPDGSDATSATVTVELQETGTVPFEGIMLRTAAIDGTVTVGDDNLPIAATVTVVGGPKDEEHTTTTNPENGEYLVENLHAGTYSVSISGYDEVEFGFDPTSKSVTVGLRDTETVAFQGDLLRTAGVSGRVHVGGMGLPGVTVTLSGEENPDPEMTDADGQYGFSGLAAGTYTVSIEITEAQAVEYAFDPTEMEFELELDESKTGVNFSGKALRTAAVMGSVTVEEAPLPGIAVTLIRVLGVNSGEIIGADATGSDGGYSFGPLLAGAYQVSIAGYDDEHDFAAGTTQSITVMTDDTASVDFAATIIRTASVSGMVTVDDEAKAGVNVTLTGDHAPDDNMKTTGEDGMYEFSGLRKGNYTVTMENPDDNLYSFPNTEHGPVNLSVGQKQGDISFAGTSLKRGSISGQVHAEGDAIEGVTVTLSGDALDDDMTDMTDANGEYNFPGLAVGEYEVTIDDPGDAYDFSDETLTKSTEIVNNDDFKIVDFEGKHARNAMVTGRLFIDEGPDEGVYHSSEPMLDRAAWADYLPEGLVPDFVTGVPVALHGPGLNDPVQYRMADAEGNYMFDGLRKGDYLVRVALSVMNPEDPTGDPIDVGALLALAGYALGGEDNDVGVPVNVTAGGESEVDFPFMITKQTINVGAVMGVPGKDGATDTKVGDVELKLYATAEDADNGENELGTMTTGAMGSEDMPNPNHGVATFEFDRDKDLGPGGQGNDHLVFAKVVKESLHEDLEFSDNQAIEIQYQATARETDALAAARLVNVQVDILWWVTRDPDAKDGTDADGNPHKLGGWKVVMGEGDDAMTHESADSADMEVAAEDHGSATLSERLTVAAAIAGASYSIALDEDVEDPAYDAMQPDMGEDWTQSTALSHEHDHLALPSDEAMDIGALHVTWETQKLTVGVYREADDTDGYTDFRSALASGDHRPHAEVAAGMEIELLVRDGRGRLERFEWDPHPETGKNRREGLKTVGSNGMVTFERIPAATEITVRFKPGTGRKQIDYGYDEIEAFNDPDDARHDDLRDFGVTLGAFGDESGGRPEVKMCSASADDQVRPRPDMPLSDKWCATFAYQWNTGTVYGKVGSEKDHTVEVEPETGQGAIGDDDETATGGGYSIGGLQDGEYTATAAAAGSAHQLLDPAEVKGIALYHNEACWAATNPDPATGDDPPSACAGEDMITGTNDDGDKTWTYANRHEQNWRTGRIGLSIKGYVANDGQDGENTDGLLRGDESMAGIELTLWNDDNDARVAGVDPVTTDASGLYSFDNLAAGDYTVRVGSASNAIALHEIKRNDDNTAWVTVTAKAAKTWDYPPFPDEQDLAKPTWTRSDDNSTGGTMGQPTTTYTVGSGTAARSATLYNFALVYTDGQLTGSVNNLSGSNASIDMVLTSPIPGEAIRKTETSGTRGTFEYSGLTEGRDYTVRIEDAGYAAPCLNADDEPDDLCPDVIDTDDDNTPDAPKMAATELMADIEGEDDHEPLGTLTVYRSDASTADSLRTLSVKGVTTLGEDAVEVGDGLPFSDDVAQDASGTQTVSLGTVTPITYRSATVTVKATVSPDAKYTVKVGTGTPLVYGDPVIPSATAGATVTIKANATATGTGPNTNADDNTTTVLGNTIAVEITAENGYNDQSYTFVVTRANPVGNQLTGDEITYPDTATGTNTSNTNAGQNTGGTGAAGTPFQVYTTGQTSNSTVVTFDLESLGSGDDAFCAQSVKVYAPGASAAMDAATDSDSDVCDGEQYSLAVNGSAYRVVVTSQDGKAWDYYVLVSNGDA